MINIKNKLPKYISEKYKELEKPIRKRLREFSLVSESEYFYELAFCICTPQSRAKNAFQVIEKLKKADFFNKPFNPVKILEDKEHYVRFHNQKAIRLVKLVENYPKVIETINSDLQAFDKRNKIKDTVDGFGYKEASHFLRNIGYRDLAILDRHILKHLVICKVYKEIPKVSSAKQYFEVEKKFQEFAKSTGIPIDELDLLFWSYETGEILK
ncbi:MAG: N-glycosylase/DNA lyase [bacterium]